MIVRFVILLIKAIEIVCQNLTIDGSISKYGEDLTLFCRVINCCSKTWSFERSNPSLTVISGNARYKISHDPDGFRLTIRNFTKVDLGGKYSCIHGFIRSKKTVLSEGDVFESLNLTVFDNLTNYGQNLTLFCGVENCCSKTAGWEIWDPRLKTIFWDVRNASRTDKYEGKLEQRGYSLIIKNLSKEDLNKSYACLYGLNRSQKKLLLEDVIFNGIITKSGSDKDIILSETPIIAGICIAVLVFAILAVMWWKRRYIINTLNCRNRITKRNSPCSHQEKERFLKDQRQDETRQMCSPEESHNPGDELLPVAEQDNEETTTRFVPGNSQCSHSEEESFLTDQQRQDEIRQKCTLEACHTPGDELLPVTEQGKEETTPKFSPGDCHEPKDEPPEEETSLMKDMITHEESRNKYSSEDCHDFNGEPKEEGKFRMQHKYLDESRNKHLPGSSITKTDREQIQSKVKRSTVGPVYPEENGITLPSNLEEWHMTEDLIVTRSSWSRLQDSMDRKKCVILKGLIGSGKTVLATRFCQAFKQEYPGCCVWKFHCTDKSMFIESMLSLFSLLPSSKDINKSFMDENTVDKVGDMILKDLRNQPGIALFLFDDVKQDSKHNVEEFVGRCRKSGNIKIIITTLLAFEEVNDTDKISIHGFTDDEATEFLTKDQCIHFENQHYLNLAKKFSNNPQGLKIARTYMKISKLSPVEMFQRLEGSSDIKSFENSRIVKDHVKDKTLFKSLHMIICEIHRSYREDRKEHIFDMLLLLQFLEVENIPVLLFENLPSATKFDTDELINAIVNSSLGNVEGKDCHRILKTHDIVVLALQIYTGDLALERREKLLKMILASFFVIMDKDFQSKENKKMHKLLLPHAKGVVSHTDDLLKSKNHIDYAAIILQCVYIKDIIGYTYSFNEMESEAGFHFDCAMTMLNSLLELPEVFQKELENPPSSLIDLGNVANQKATELSCAVNRILHNENVEVAIQELGKHYVLNKYRNERDIKVLKEALGIDKLTRKNQLTEIEYEQLCRKDYAVPNESLGKRFLYELIISVFHTYGRRLFYQQTTDKRLKTFYAYLKIANILCKTYALEDSFHIVLTERSVMQAFLKFQKDDEQVEWFIKILKQLIDDCEERLSMERHYLEFCVVKFLPGEIDIRFIWLKLLVRSCTELVKWDKSLFHTYKVWVERLLSKMKDKKHMDYYFSIVYAVAEFYFVSEEMVSAESYYKQILSDSFHEENEKVVRFRWFQRQACVKYFQCRIKRATRDESDEIIEEIDKYRKYLEGYDEEEKDLDELSCKLIKRLDE